MTTDKALFVIFFTVTVMLIIGLAMLFVSIVKERRREDRETERKKAMERHPAGKKPVADLTPNEYRDIHSYLPAPVTQKKVLYKHRFKLWESGATRYMFVCRHC